MTQRRQTALLLWLAVSTLPGCGSGREPARYPVVYDFAASLPSAAATYSGRAPRSLPGGAASPSATDAAIDALEIPIGARLDYFLRVPPEAFLTIDRITPGEGNPPGEPGTLTVVIGRDGEADETLLEIEGAAERQVVPVPARNHPIVRISFQVGPAGPRRPACCGSSDRRSAPSTGTTMTGRLPRWPALPATCVAPTSLST